MTRTRIGIVSTGLIALVVGCWILAAPPSAGPDEPAHIVRGARLVRGDFDGMFGTAASGVAEDLPAWVGFPDPVCYAQQPTVSASCLTELEFPTGRADLPTSAASYPIWGHLLPGLATFGPPTLERWSARVLSALLPALLVGSALAAARAGGRLRVAGVVLSMTPMVWFTAAVVNPSSLVIAGGVAFSALTPDLPTASRRARWIAVASWAAMSLSRRDGLIWASLLLGVVVLGLGVSAAALVGALSRPQRTVAVAATVWPLLGAFAAPSTTTVLRLVAVLAVGALVGGVHVWRRWGSPRWVALLAAVVGVVAGTGVYVVAVNRRANGFDPVFVRLIVGRTGDNLVEAVGLLGWLDTPVPLSMVLLWMVAVGLLAAPAVLLGERRLLRAAGAALFLAIAVSWIIESVNESYSGNYWQGRYYLPLLVAVPIVLGRARLAAAAERRLAVVVVVAAAIVWNFAFMAAIRRWAVGLGGTYYPWRWDTYASPLHPVALIVLHAVVTAVLGWWAVAGPATADPHEDVAVRASAEPPLVR